MYSKVKKEVPIEPDMLVTIEYSSSLGKILLGLNLKTTVSGTFPSEFHLGFTTQGTEA